MTTLYRDRAPTLRTDLAECSADCSADCSVDCSADCQASSADEAGSVGLPTEERMQAEKKRLRLLHPGHLSACCVCAG